MPTWREDQEAAKSKKSFTQATLVFGSLQLAHQQPTVLSAPANQEVIAAAAAAGIGLIIGKTGSWNWLSEKAVPILRSWVLQLAHYGIEHHAGTYATILMKGSCL